MTRRLRWSQGGRRGPVEPRAKNDAAAAAARVPLAAPQGGAPSLDKQGRAELRAILSGRLGVESTALDAFALAIEGVPIAERRPFVEAALQHPSRWVRERALVHMIQLDEPADRPKVLAHLKHLLSDSDVAIALAAARTIAQRGDASCERALLRALNVEDLGLRRAVAEALGAVGTIAALPQLRRASAETGLLLAPSLRSAMVRSIQRIRTRFPAIADGQLSLAERREISGRISLTEQEHVGTLSLSESAGSESQTVRRPK